MRRISIFKGEMSKNNLRKKQEFERESFHFLFQGVYNRSQILIF